MNARIASTPDAALDDFLRPLTADEFFANYLGELPVHITGGADRFRPLHIWESLNRILSYPLEGLDLQLKKNGAVVPKERYSEPARGLFGNFSRIDLRKLQALFREGAMLSVRNFEIWDQQVSGICRLLEVGLGCYVHAVAFAGWRGTQGFNTHWDSHDAFIIQITGSKHWRLFAPVHKHPIKAEDAPRLEPAQSPHWEGDLACGDILYIPRGWWHDAVPVGELSLHITLGGRPPTGVDLARQVVERLAENELFRASLPRHRSESERLTYLASLRRIAHQILDEISMDSFLRHQQLMRPARDRVSLPWTAVPDAKSFPLPGSSRIHWLPLRSIPLQIFDGDAVLEADGRKFTFSLEAVPVLQDLIGGRQIQVSQLRERYVEADIDNFLVHLISSHLVAISCDPDI